MSRSTRVLGAPRALTGGSDGPVGLGVKQGVLRTDGGVQDFRRTFFFFFSSHLSAQRSAHWLSN